jgi:hypothetical protein
VYVFPPAVTVAVRAAPVLAAAVTVTVPEPVPLAGDTVAHVALLEAVQPHDVPFVVTVTLAVPPVAATDPVDEERLKLHVTAGWLTVYVCPPAVTVAVRAAPVLAAAVTVTVPEPVPLAGDTVAHVALLEAVQPHDVPFVVTVTLAVPPVAATDPVDEERL